MIELLKRKGVIGGVVGFFRWLVKGSQRSTASFLAVAAEEDSGAARC